MDPAESACMCHASHLFFIGDSYTPERPNTPCMGVLMSSSAHRCTVPSRLVGKNSERAI